MFTKENVYKLSNEIFLLFLAINSKIVNHNQMLKNCSFPPSHMKVVFYLYFNGPSSVSKIAKDLVISKPNMTPIIDNLIAEGYAIRYDDPNDRRMIIIEATEKAHQLLEQKKRDTLEALSDKLSDLDTKDLETLREITPRFVEILGKIQ